MRTLLLAALLLSFPPFATSQETPSVSAFIDTARAATSRYQDQAAAIADGYRRIGSDFPAMGEHWIHIGLLFDNQFDPAHPEVLMYAVVSDRPQLLGVAYALPLLKDESPPDWPVSREAWHDHFRTLTDETDVPMHHLHGQAGAAPRIAMLHAWIWLANPAGMFAADNWAIPYLRLGIPPAPGPESAAKALALASGGDEYFLDCVTATAPLTSAEQKKVRTEFKRSRRSVELLLRSRGAELSSSDLEQLRHYWGELWTAIDSSVDAKSRAALQQVSIR